VFVDGMVGQAQATGPPLGPIVEGQRTAMSLGMFTVTAVGLPAAGVGLLYLLLFADRLLPTRRDDTEPLGDEGELPRRFTVEMLVADDAPFLGRTVGEAGLRNLPGLYLVEIERGGDRLVAVGPEQVLRQGDRLIFAGVVDAVVELQKIRGLVPAADEVFDLDDPRPNRRLVEAVVSGQNPLLGQTIREGRFRTRYDAAVIAAYRGGERLERRLGDVRLRVGDTLLLDTHPRFVDRQRNRQEFILVSAVGSAEARREQRAWVAVALLIAMVLLTTLTPMRLVTAALLAAGGMLLTGCLRPDEARQSVNWRVLIAMGSALGVGSALESTGAATQLASALVDAFAAAGPTAILAAVYLAAMVLTSLIGPIGTVALVFPVAQAAALAQGLNFEPFAIALMMTAAASFATPTAYQTNLMVYSLGGYRFADFLRIGLPLNLLVMAVTLLIAPRVWPF
jgi:di/tricarboxylate transporter